MKFSLSTYLMTLAAAAVGRGGELLETLGPYVDRAVAEAQQLPESRTELLSSAADKIAASIDGGDRANLVFICSHNSRRSHLSQVWAQVAAQYHDLPQISTYSGGTEATACNIRTVRAMRRAGLSIVNQSFGPNPVYLVQYAERQPPLKAYSKRFTDKENPAKGFWAMMCCSEADEACPVVTGAAGRIALHYEDPKVADDTPRESEAYDERSRQIAAEMFYLMSQIKRRLPESASK